MPRGWLTWIVAGQNYKSNGTLLSEGCIEIAYANILLVECLCT